jgi:hypothetical protein
MFFYQLSGLFLDPSSQLNQLDYVKTTSTRVNFKLKVSKMLDREGSRLVHWIIFNNNVIYFFSAFKLFFIRTTL